jgi:hypothetical protein
VNPVFHQLKGKHDDGIFFNRSREEIKIPSIFELRAVPNLLEHFTPDHHPGV